MDTEEQIEKWAQLIDQCEVYDRSIHEVGESYMSFSTNTSPIKHVHVDITTIDDRQAVILIVPFKSGIFIYFPKRLEVASHDYDESGKSIFIVKFDDYWGYKEKIISVQGIFSGIGYGNHPIFTTNSWLQHKFELNENNTRM